MAQKPKARPEADGPEGQAKAKPVRILVRRGALRRFDELKKKTANLPVELSWDRRLGDRRRANGSVEQERRGADRRKQTPFTWELADFVVLPEEEPE